MISPQPVYDFTGAVVIVTGGASGIGLEVARAFAKAGARVEMWDLRPGALADAAALLASEGLSVRPVEADVTSPEAVNQAAGAVLERHGKMDILINNAGLNTGDQHAGTLPESALEAMLAVNLKGTVNCVRALAPAMVKAGCGVITNTASILAKSPLPVAAAYAASKAGVIAFTRAWSRELGPSGVRVNVVAPGFIETPMNRNLPPGLAQTLIARTPLRRIGLAEEVAALHLFLASGAASFINGAMIPIDGGLSL
ncbi:MAG: SDR family NAD(P)-dependent oxidoreductase [Verrucomicrobiota bacterium]